MTAAPAVAVVVTAKDAASTIGKAVASALAQGPVAEVVVVDDGSADGTAGAARAGDDGSGRLRVITLPANRGPSHGRNVAVAASTAPLLCILDADDFFGAGRLERLLARGGGDWDLLADDLIFASGPDEALAFDRLLPPGSALPTDLTLAAFARGNVGTRPRRELGFLKPVIRRAFLDRHGLRYDERLRLGEDFVLFAACLARGARFRLVEACGYYAVQSPRSLSGSHATEAVARLHEALLALRAGPEHGQEGEDGMRALDAYRARVRRNLAVRRALDAKRAGGWAGLLAALRRMPGEAPGALYDLVAAKLGALAGGRAG